jgi:hypothetical protein
VTSCLECGRPWGVILERGELPSEKAQNLAQLGLEEELMEYLEDDFDEDNGGIFNLEGVPQAEPQEVVFVTYALAAFASEHFDSCIGEVPAWYALDDLDIPAWLLKGRARRWAYKWDCCGLDLSSFEVVMAEVVR